MESLPKIFNWESSKDFCRRMFLFIWTERFNFLFSNFQITLLLFFSRWHACKSSGATSCQVREIALQTVSSRTLSQISRGTRLTSRYFLRWYWTFLTGFHSNLIICWCTRALLFFVINRLDFNSSCFEVSNQSFKAFNSMLISDNWSSSSVNFSPEKFSIWVLVKTMLIEINC